jgi:HEAT repeat protein
VLMALTNRSAVTTALTELFDAQRRTRALVEQIASGDNQLVLDALVEATQVARDRPTEEERTLELASIAQILGRVSGPGAVDALVEILGSDEPESRHAAGLVLEDLAFDRFKEVALGIERALTQLPADHLALPELPYILIELPEPGVPKLLHRFLDHPNEEVVAAAIEAVVEIGDVTAGAKLAKLEKDARLIELEDEDDESDGSVTIGELAKEARLLLQSEGDA